MNDLIQKLESYNWVDELGHPLVNCVDWIWLKARVEIMQNSLDSVFTHIDQLSKLDKEND